MLYDFYCDKCQYQFDEFTSYEQRHFMKCHKCGGSARKLITRAVSYSIDSKVVDDRGTPIHFKEGEFDRALQKTFGSKKEKQKYLKDNKLVMDGSSDNPNRNKNPEAGDTRKGVPVYFT